MAIPTSNSTEQPSIINNFFHLLHSFDWDKGEWHDHSKDQSNTPHIPAPADEVLHAVCVAEFNKKTRIPGTLTTFEQFLLNTDSIVVILTNLDLKTLLNCSEVSKCFYLATKAEIVWEAQLFSFLPNVTPIPLSNCVFTTSQQFQIVYKAVKNAKKPFIAKLEHEHARYLSLKGPNGELEQTWNQFQAAGGMEAYERVNQRCAQEGLTDEERDEIKASPDHEAWTLYNRYINLLEQAYYLNGDEDPRITKENSVFRSLTADPVQKQLQYTIDVQVLDAFNKQAEYEKAIRDSEKAQRDRIQAATQAQNSTVVVEDVTDAETQPQNANPASPGSHS